MGYLTREQSPQTASLTSVFILILNNLTFKISSFHLLHCQQRALQTLTGDNRSFHSKPSLLRGSSAGALVVLCPRAFRPSPQLWHRREQLHYSNAFCVSAICHAEGLSSAIKRWVVLSYASCPLLN